MAEDELVWSYINRHCLCVSVGQNGQIPASAYRDGQPQPGGLPDLISVAEPLRFYTVAQCLGFTALIVKPGRALAILADERPDLERDVRCVAPHPEQIIARQAQSPVREPDLILHKRQRFFQDDLLPECIGVEPVCAGLQSPHKTVVFHLRVHVPRDRDALKDADDRPWSDCHRDIDGQERRSRQNPADQPGGKSNGDDNYAPPWPYRHIHNSEFAQRCHSDPEISL